jgi:molecular chaperone DnaK
VRKTIDYGIDLGRTNSRIAVCVGTEVRVLRNNENFEYTPSVVWIDKTGRLYAGRPAYEQLNRDPDKLIDASVL